MSSGLELVVDTDTHVDTCVEFLVEALGELYGNDEVLVHGNLKTCTGAADNVMDVARVINQSIIRCSMHFVETSKSIIIGILWLVLSSFISPPEPFVDAKVLIGSQVIGVTLIIDIVDQLGIVCQCSEFVIPVWTCDNTCIEERIDSNVEVLIKKFEIHQFNAELSVSPCHTLG